jgi:hypothetical protein
MPGRESYTSRRMHAVAERSLADYLRARPATEAALLNDVRCEYAGVAQTDGTHDPQAPIHKNSTVAFRWRTDCDGLQTTVVEVRSYHAVARGIAFPPQWHLAPRCRDLQAKADASAAQAAKALGVGDASCRFLGQPRRSLLPEETDQLVPGAVVELRLGSVAAEFLLCAHVQEDVWFCTRGLFVEDMFQASDPFGEASLVLKDVQRDAWWEDPQAPRKRVRPHLRRGQLWELAAAWCDRWDMAVAVATWRAEVMRAQLQGRPFDDEQACSAFELNPFRWNGASGRNAFSAVVTLWSWPRTETLRELFHLSRLDHVLERGFSAPQLASADDETLRCKLGEVAELETQQRKAPCVYLGVALSSGKFEADPSKWLAKHYPATQGKTKAMVHFEWVGVSIDGKPHRIVVCANDILHHQRALHQHPLRDSAPSGLKFSTTFMDAVARNVREGARFKGITFEGERPTIVLHLPLGGVDIQDEPVYWVLPDGRCECFSVRRMAEITDDDLAPQDSEEAYKAVAKEMNYDVLGMAAEEALEAFRLAPGTLVERLWENINWRCPLDEASSCWWIANAGEPEKTLPVKLVARSLECLRLELQATRCATSVKLRQTW